MHALWGTPPYRATSTPFGLIGRRYTYMANDAKFNFYLNRQGPRGQKGEKGDQGFSPSITVNTDTADEYTLLIQNEYNSFVTDNIRPTYDDRGGTYVRVDRTNNVQYFGSADIATTANYGEVKLAQASDLASTVAVGNSNVITAELLKTWFDGQLADNLVTTTNNVTIQGQKVFATPTRFMDTVRIGNRLMVAQDDTGTISFDTDETGTLIGTDATFKKDVRVNGGAIVDGNLNVNGTTTLRGNASIFGALDVKSGLTVQTGGIKVQGGELDATGRNTITKNLLLSPGPLKRVKGFSGYLLADTSAISPDEFIAVGDERLSLRLVGTKITANGKDVATADTVEAMQSDLNIAKQDIIEAQGDIDNLQMNKQNKLTAGTGITIDADNVISATGGSTGDVSAAGDNTFTGENTFNGAVNLNGVSIAENLTVTRNLTSNGEINAVSIKTTGLCSDDIKTTANKKYLTEVDVDNQTIQVVDGKLHANLDELGNEVNSLTGEVNNLTGEVNTLSGDVTTLSGKVTAVEGKTTDLENALANKQDKLTAVSPVNIATKVLSPTEGWTVLSSSMQSRYKEKVANNGDALYGDGTGMHLSSDSEYPIKSYVAMPYTVGQVIKYRHNRTNSTLTTLVLGDIIDGKIYPILISSARGDYHPQYTTALFDGTQELTKEVMTNGIGYSSTDSPGPINQPFINEATFGCLQNTGTGLIWHVFTPRNAGNGDYGKVTYKNFNGYTINDLVGKIKYAIILAGSTSLVYTPDQFGVYENTLSSYSNISDYQALSPNLFDLSKNEVQTQITTLPATISSLGVVKPDGTTITITDDGTISAVGGGDTVESTTLQQETQFTLNLTSNGTLGGSTPACTGSTFETGHPYYYAFKGATSSTPTRELWGPSSGTGNQYLILDCVTPIPLQSFRWTNGGNSQERFPVIVFKGSNDNSNYTTLGTYNTQNPTDDSVTIENYTPYRYYRFDFPEAANYGKLGFISMSGFNRYNILNIGDGLDVINGQLTCTPSDAPILDVPVNNCVLAMPTAPTFDGTNVKVYAGTKVAIPNGLNADGTCKSNIVTLTTDATINQSTFNGDVTLMLKSDGTIDQTAYSYFEVDDISTITTLTAYCWYYDRKTNNHYLASSAGAKQGPYQRIKIGSYNQAEAATTKYFRTYKPIALEKLDITGSCMPDYSAGKNVSSATIHTATVDGYVFAQASSRSGGNGGHVDIYDKNGTLIKSWNYVGAEATQTYGYSAFMCPIPKGYSYKVYGGVDIVIQFYPAKGTEV